MTRRLLIILALAAALLGGCRSECTKLCERQAECSRAPEAATDGDLDPDKRRELCVTVCEAAAGDRRLEGALSAAFTCASERCGEFEKCLSRVSVPTATVTRN